MRTSRRGFVGTIAAFLGAATVGKLEAKDFSGDTEYDHQVKVIKEAMKEGRFAKLPKVDFDYNKLYVSQDVWDDIKNWGIDQIDEQTRREILLNDEIHEITSCSPPQITHTLACSGTLIYEHDQ
jgi:hypothetical protein